MSRFRWDFTELHAFGHEMRSADTRLRRGLSRDLNRVGRNAAQRARDHLTTQRVYTKHYPRAITHTANVLDVSVEIGPQLGRKQAFLGKILERGTATSPPKPHLVPAAEDVAPQFARALVDAARRAVIAGGGR